MRTLFGILALAALGSAPLTAQAPTLTNSIGMEFVLVQPGSFTVGRFEPICRRPAPRPDRAPEGRRGQGGEARPARPAPDPRSQWTDEDWARCDQMAAAAAHPGFTATVDHPFYIGKYEVTQAQWKQVMGTNPSTFQGDKVTDDADRHPVESVTWDDAQAFIARLNEMEPDAHYRLPTEFEWSLAARAGSTDDVILIADQRKQAQTSRSNTLMVGQKEPNAFGVYDMLGNVWEWVDDFYNHKVFPDSVPPSTGTLHVLKGAGFLGDPKNLTWTYHGAGPGDGWDVGFRVVRDVQ